MQKEDVLPLQEEDLLILLLVLVIVLVLALVLALVVFYRRGRVWRGRVFFKIP